MSRGRPKGEQKPNLGLSPELKAQLELSARESDVKMALLRLGVRRSQILELVENYALELIEQQLEWLPYRRARKPSSLIVAAIKENYDEPATLPATTSNSNNDYRAKEAEQKANQ